MKKYATIHEVFIASPSDTNEERECVSNVISYANKVLGTNDIYLDPIKWETDISPGLGQPQQKINEQLLNKDFSLCIAILKHRLGTTVIDDKTGTEFEIEYLLNKEKDIMLFIYDQKPNEEDEQYKKLQNFISKIISKTIYVKYQDISEFKFMLFYHLIKRFYDVRDKLNGIVEDTFIQFNPNDPFQNRIKSKNVISLVDNGTLDFTINFDKEIDPAKLSVHGYERSSHHEIINPKQISASIQIKFFEPCPNTVTIRSAQV